MERMGQAPLVGINQGFWKDRAVLVTGHTGFIGGWLCLWLHRLQARVAGLALPPPTTPSFCELVGLEDLVESHVGDIRSPADIADTLSRQQPEIIFHLAAQPIVRLAHDQPAETFETNVMGTVHLLDAVRQCPSVKAVVIMTSDKVYENREWPWGYRESDRLGGREPYGVSKACAELVTRAFSASYFQETGPKIATVRAGNVIGGGDWAADRLVPDAVRSFANKEVLRLRRPGAVRPWQHVLEPAAGCLMLAEWLWGEPHGNAIEGWNFGPEDGDTRPVLWLAQEAARLWGKDARCEVVETGGPYEATLLMINNNQAKSRLGWRPRWQVEEALARSIEWYRAWEMGRQNGQQNGLAAMRPDLRDLAREQIAAYDARLMEEAA